MCGAEVTDHLCLGRRELYCSYTMLFKGLRLTAGRRPSRVREGWVEVTVGAGEVWCREGTRQVSAESSMEKTGAGAWGTPAAPVRGTGADCPGCLQQPKVGRAVGEGGGTWSAMHAGRWHLSAGNKSVAHASQPLPWRGEADVIRLQGHCLQVDAPARPAGVERSGVEASMPQGGDVGKGLRQHAAERSYWRDVGSTTGEPVNRARACASQKQLPTQRHQKQAALKSKSYRTAKSKVQEKLGDSQGLRATATKHT